MSSPPMDSRPPRHGARMVVRLVLASMLVLLVTGSAVAATLWGEGKTVEDAFGENPETQLPAEVTNALDDVQQGKPQTLLLVGDDFRYGDDPKAGTRSDTMILVRLDENAKATTMLSLPRDLVVTHPGGTRGKLNQSYAGGADNLITTLRDILSTPERPFPIHHYVSIRFTAFAQAVNAFGCFYADIDRTYFNPPNTGYAEIDVKSGYQRLCGLDSLAYVRFRHTDSDLVREARQTHYLAEARAQIANSRILRDRKKLIKAIVPYIKTDIRKSENILGIVKLATAVAGTPTKRVPLAVTDTADGNLATTDANLHEAAREFLDPEAVPGQDTRAARDAKDGTTSTGGDAADATSTSDTPAKPATKRKVKRKQGKNPGTLRDATAAGKAIVATKIANKLKTFPLYYPQMLTLSGVYDENSTRQYDIRSPGGQAYPWQAYRLVVKAAGPGQYYGVQGTTWKDPPILKLADDQERLGGKTFLVHYDGSKIRRMIYRGSEGTYWVTNTLSNALSNAEMRAIARSLTRYRAGR